MYRHGKWIVLASCFILGLAVDAGLAASPASVLQQLAAGANISVGRAFPPESIFQFTQAGHERVVVDCRGIPLSFATRYVQSGAQVMVDRSYPSANVLQLVQAGRSRVWVFGSQFPVSDLVSYSRLGATILSVGGSFSFQDLQSILGAGGGLVVDVGVLGNDVVRLASIGHQRVTVYGSRFTGPVIRSFIQAGARVVIDSSLIQTDVAQMCAMGGNRVIVLTNGFLVSAANQFAGSGAQVITDNTLGVPGINGLCASAGTRLTVRAHGFIDADLTRFAHFRVHIDYGANRASMIRTHFSSLYSVTDGPRGACSPFGPASADRSTVGGSLTDSPCENNTAAIMSLFNRPEPRR